jgi:hypothetical protein
MAANFCLIFAINPWWRYISASAVVHIPFSKAFLKQSILGAERATILILWQLQVKEPKN